MHSELWVLAGTLAAFLIIGLPRIRRNVSLSETITALEVPDSALTPIQREFFADADRRMVAIGYQPLAFYRLVPLSGTNLNRLYQSALGSGIAMVYAMTSSRGLRPIEYVEFVQDFTDGTRLTTRNAPFSGLFDRAPNDLARAYPALLDPAELKLRHEAEAGRLGLIPISARAKEEIFRFALERHRRMCELQVQRGLLRLDPRARVYRATTRLGLRGIRNFVNPFADNFTWARAAAALAVGAGLAAVGPSCAGRYGTLLLLYAVAGAVMGAIFENKAFIWTFLVAYLSTLWFLLDDQRLLPSLVMAYVAHKAAGWRRGRRSRIA